LSKTNPLVSALGTKRLLRLAAPLIVTTEQPQLGAAAGKLQSRGPSDPGVRPGHQADAARQVFSEVLGPEGPGVPFVARPIEGKEDGLIEKNVEKPIDHGGLR
jgi:hypothetical protein